MSIWSKIKGLFGRDGWGKGVTEAFIADLMTKGVGSETTATSTPGKAGVMFAKFMKTRFGGAFSYNDEVLAKDAYEIAEYLLKNRVKDPEGKALKKLYQLPGIIKSLCEEEDDKRKIRCIIGYREIMLPEDIQKDLGKTTGNLEGATMICMLCRMTNKQIKNYLAHIGAFDTMTERIESTKLMFVNTFKAVGGEKILQALKDFDDSRKEKVKKKREKYFVKKGLYEERKAKKIPFFKNWLLYASIIILCVIVILSQKGIGVFH